MKRLALTVILLLSASKAPAQDLVELPGGESLKIFGVSEVNATDRTAWMLRYETLLNLDVDRERVLREVIGLWHSYARERVELNELDYFVICANTPQEGTRSEMLCHFFQLGGALAP